jgi:hypothetical protein
MKRACKIVTSYFGNRRTTSRDQWKVYNENPELHFNDQMERFKDMIDDEKSTDAGVEFDTIIVNHLLSSELGLGVGMSLYEKANDKVIEFLNSINNTQTKNGRIITLNRPHNNGEGFGFKSRDYAFKKYQDNYEYWFFVEDDVNFFYDGYYKKCIDILEKDKNVAYVCTCHNEVEKRPARHCHGSVGCTHIRFLRELIKLNGCIPYPNNDTYKGAEMQGEVEGTNIYVRMGYSLQAVGEIVHKPKYWTNYEWKYHDRAQRRRGEWTGVSDRDK